MTHKERVTLEVLEAARVLIDAVRRAEVEGLEVEMLFNGEMAGGHLGRLTSVRVMEVFK